MVSAMRTALFFLAAAMMITAYLLWSAHQPMTFPIDNGEAPNIFAPTMRFASDRASMEEQTRGHDVTSPPIPIPYPIPSPIQNRPVRIGVESASLPACPAIVRTKTRTRIYWAPDETRIAKANLDEATPIALCEGSSDNAWFGVVFAPSGGSLAECQVSRRVSSIIEYQGPCRWGWIKGGSVVAK